MQNLNSKSVLAGIFALGVFIGCGTVERSDADATDSGGTSSSGGYAGAVGYSGASGTSVRNYGGAVGYSGGGSLGGNASAGGRVGVGGQSVGPAGGRMGQGGSSAGGGVGVGGTVTTMGGRTGAGGSPGGVGGNGRGGAVSVGGNPSAGGTVAGDGGASAGGTDGTGGLTRGPTPATDGAKFPFPQNRESPNCIYPAGYRNEDVLAVYQQWKADLVTSDGAGGFQRVKRPAEPGLEVNSTVSEGIAYGMLISVYMNDQELFDNLWKYEQIHTWTSVPWGGGQGTPTSLMNWYISSSGNLGADPSGEGAATDADEDMAWALIMADRQWGGQGSLSKSYLDTAKQLLSDIWTYEILDGKLPKNGSGWGGWDSLNVSYFAPAFYRVFANVSGNGGWGGDVVNCVYDTIATNLTAENGNQSNGLVPAFSTSTGGQAVVTAGQSALRHDYQYDSCRTPYRIGVDACLFNESRAKTYLAKTSQFFAGIGAANIKDGYALNGTPTPEFPDKYEGRSGAFIGPAGVGAMHDSAYQPFVNDVWELVKGNNLWCGGQYYDESWTMLTLLMMSGNFLDYTAIEPL